MDGKSCFSSVRSEAQHVPSHASVFTHLCGALRCDVVFVCLPHCPLDRMMNGNTSPEEKKQEVEGEKLPEETSVGENHRYIKLFQTFLTVKVENKEKGPGSVWNILWWLINLL